MLQFNWESKCFVGYLKYSIREILQFFDNVLAADFEVYDHGHNIKKDKL